MILEEGGLVVGAKWADDFLKVEHVAVNSEEGLRVLQGSKYLVSDLHKAYGEIKRALERGKRVLFIGTPCQTYAIRHKYGSNRLLLVCAIACFGNIPAIIWRKYVSYLEEQKKSKIAHVVFRDNSSGWKNSRFVAEFVNGSSINERLYDNEYMKVFLSGWANMQSFLACQFRNGGNGADLLVGDFWGIDDIFPDMSDNKGVNVILAYSALLIDMLKRLKLDLREVKYEQAVAKNTFIEALLQGSLREDAESTILISEDSGVSSDKILADGYNVIPYIVDEEDGSGDYRDSNSRFIEALRSFLCKKYAVEKTGVLEGAKRLFKSGEYDAAVVSAWTELEAYVRREYPCKNFTPFIARLNDLIDGESQLRHDLIQVRRLRNEVVHGVVKAREKDAKRAIDVVSKFLSKHQI